MITTNRKQNILIILSSVFILCIVLSNILSIKVITIFQLDNGINIQTTLPCIIIFPMSFVVSDIISNCYGYKQSRFTAWIGFACSILTSIIFYIASSIKSGQDLSVLSTTWIITLSSLTAYIISGWINDVIFEVMMQKDGNKNIIGRCLLSSLCGQIIDSMIFLSLSMHIIPYVVYGYSYMCVSDVLMTALIQVVVKMLFELVISPITKLLCDKISEIN